MCSGLRMLPGLRRRQCTPASSAASAMRYWWWMSATIGTGERGTIWARPSAASTLVAGAAHDVGPGAVRARRSAASVPSTSAVLVVVIDCTVIGASPPTATGLVGWRRTIWPRRHDAAESARSEPAPSPDRSGRRCRGRSSTPSSTPSTSDHDVGDRQQPGHVGEVATPLEPPLLDPLVDRRWPRGRRRTGSSGIRLRTPRKMLTMANRTRSAAGSMAPTSLPSPHDADDDIVSRSCRCWSRDRRVRTTSCGESDPLAVAALPGRRTVGVAAVGDLVGEAAQATAG